MRFEGYLKEAFGEDVLDVERRVMLKHKGVVLVDTRHGHDRIKERNTLSPAEMKELFTSAIDKFIKMKKHVGEHISFWSRKQHQAFIAAVDDRNTLSLITYYPRHDKPGRASHPFQKEVVLEGKTCTFVEID
jgi:hypothetical protein